MAENIGLMTLTGTTQGKIAASENKRAEGDLTFNTGIEVHAFEIGAQTPTDPSRLVVTGRCAFKVLTIFKPFDSTSPKFFQFAATGEVITKASLVFNKIDPTGKPKKFNQIDLTNAIVVQFLQSQGDKAGTQGAAITDDNVNQYLHDLERIDFVYETITFTNLWANTVATASVIGAKG